MKTRITFDFENDDDPRDYIDPIIGLRAVSDITGYLRNLDKYGSDFKTVFEAIEKIREQVREFCHDIPDDWKQ